MSPIHTNSIKAIVIFYFVICTIFQIHLCVKIQHLQLNTVHFSITKTVEVTLYLILTDIHTQWTENEATSRIGNAVKDVRRAFIVNHVWWRSAHKSNTSPTIIIISKFKKKNILSTRQFRINKMWKK